MTWRRSAFPAEARELQQGEPSLAQQLLAWRAGGANSAACADLITVDARGRYWLWRREWSIFAKTRRVKAEKGAPAFTECVPGFVLLPVYGPLPRARKRGDEAEVLIRAALDALALPARAA